jgi:hypothetical protein
MERQRLNLFLDCGEFTQHTPDEMYRAGRGWGTEWSPGEATVKQGAESAR